MKRLTLTDFIGYTGSVVGTLIMLPQVVKSLETKQVQDVSAIMLLLYLANCLLWLVYGIRLRAKPVMIANVAGFVIGAAQMALKIMYG